MKRSLGIVLGLSLFGMLFSGVLSFVEIHSAGAPVCPSPGAPGTILGFPACVYGFFMFLLVAAAAAWGLGTRQG